MGFSGGSHLGDLPGTALPFLSKVGEIGDFVPAKPAEPANADGPVPAEWCKRRPGTIHYGLYAFMASVAMISGVEHFVTVDHGGRVGADDSGAAGVDLFDEEWQRLEPPLPTTVTQRHGLPWPGGTPNIPRSHRTSGDT
jgi:hypothetical protein